MCTFQITNDPTTYFAERFLEAAGPTLTNTINVDGIYITHNLLNITGEITPQPIYKEGKYFLLLGEIYNYDRNFPSDIFFGIEKYLEHGDGFTRFLDGEFLFIVFDPATRTIDFFNDPWATRLSYYYTKDDYFHFSTWPILDGIINPRHYGDKYFRLIHNAHYRFDIDSNQLDLINDELHSWDFTQYKDSLDDITVAFESAVLKRWHENITLHLSGGLDSGSIALCLADHKKSFNSVTLLVHDVEDTVPLYEILDYVAPFNAKHIITHIEDTSKDYEFPRRWITTPPLGSLNLCAVREANMDCFNSEVILTGNGGDEILCNYIDKGKSEFTVWPDDLSTVFPWQHFYGGQTRVILDCHEYCSLAYGMEMRNVFYDKSLAQEWMHLTPALKNREPKVLQKSYFDRHGITKPDRVVGFSSSRFPHNYDHINKKV